MERGHISKPSYLQDCQRLIEEGGADYDYSDVNPGTVWSVLRGTPPPGTASRKVVPPSSGAVFFAIYSHGDCHPCSAAESRALGVGAGSGTFVAPARLDPLKHEWFAHMPYQTRDEKLSAEMLSFVATSGATGPHFNCPGRYFYATQLRAVLVSMFARRPDRPVIALLNFCRSGGALEFMRQPITRDYYSADQWPLVLISSSQAEYDSLVGGMWNSFFHHLSKEISKIMQPPVEPSGASTRSRSDLSAQPTESMSILELVNQATASYFRNNVYALYDFVVHSAHVSNYQNSKLNTYAKDLRPLLASGPGGVPDYDAITALQLRYRARRVFIWDTHDWEGPEVDLAGVVREAFYTKIARPEVVYGAHSSVHTLTIREVFKPITTHQLVSA